MSTGERWTTEAELAAARDRFAAQIDCYQPPAAYALARRDEDGLVFGHVNRVGEVRGLPAAALAVACGYSRTSGSYELTAAQVTAVLDALAPAEAATHVQHPNIWTWRGLLRDGSDDANFVAFYLSHPDDEPQTPEEKQFHALAKQR